MTKPSIVPDAWWCASLVACLVGCSSARGHGSASLVTTAERTAYQRTGRYDEVLALCSGFADRYDGVRCEQIGTTAGGRPLVALVIARRQGMPTVLVQAGIHAGEIEGKDAGFVFLRDLLDGRVAAGALDRVSIVFVPVLNPDGHERFSANHRPNQRGPLEIGFRTNGSRLNLNRDWVKAEAAETQAALRVLTTFDPVLHVDLHTTDGAKFEHDLSINLAPIAPRSDGLDEVANDLSTKLIARLTELGHLPIDFYPAFVDDERPHSGFTRGEAPPRFATSYMAARSRLGVLVETHSWRTYAERAKATYHTLQAIMERAIRDAPLWRKITLDADRADTSLGGTDVPLIFGVGPRSRDIDFRGYAYERRVSELTGGTWLVYDEQKPEVWHVPLYDQMVPEISARAPKGGYIVDGGFGPAVSAVLDRHGIVWTPIAESGAHAVEAFRATSVTFGAPYEGRARAQLVGAWAPEARNLDRGAIFVPITQPKARLILHIFDPALPDSLVQWGLFNAVFERKEYIEPYVMEQAAREMLESRPGLRAEWELALATDPELAASIEKRLDWFYRRHPAWDERVNLVPVYRTAEDLRPR